METSSNLGLMASMPATVGAWAQAALLIAKRSVVAWASGVVRIAGSFHAKTRRLKRRDSIGFIGVKRGRYSPQRRNLRNNRQTSPRRASLLAAWRRSEPVERIS